MNITIYIDADGNVTISDLPLELCGIIQDLNPSFFPSLFCNECSSNKPNSDLLEKQSNKKIINKSDIS